MRQWNDRWRRAILASLAGALPTLSPILRAPQAFSNPLPHLSRHMRSIVDALVTAGAAGAEAAAAVVAAAMRAEQQQQQAQDEVAQHDGYSSDDEKGQDDDDEDEDNEVDAVANGDAPLLARRRRARRRPVSPPVVTGKTDRQDSGAAVDGDATDAMDVDSIATSPLSPSSWRLPFLSSSRTAAVAPADSLAKDCGAVSAESDDDGANDNDEIPLHPPSPVLTQPGLTSPVNATPRRKRRRVESIPTSTTTTLTTITGPCLVVTPAGMVPPTATVAASASAAAAATVRAGHAVATAAVSVAASSATAVAAWAPRNPRAAVSLWAMLRGDAIATVPAQEGADATPSAALDLDADVDRVVSPAAPADGPAQQTADPDEATIEVEDEDGARESTQLLPGRARRIPPVAREPSALSLDEDAPAARPPASRRTIPPRRIVPASSTVTSRRVRTEGDYVVNQLRSMFSARGTATPAPPPPLTRTPSVSSATTTAPTTATVPVPLDAVVDAIPSPPVSDPEEGEAKPEDAEVVAAQDADTAKAVIARLPRGQRLDYVLQVPPARGILPANEYLGGLRAHFNYWGSKDVMWFVLRTLDGVLADALGFEDASEDEEVVAVGEPVEGAAEKGNVGVADAVVEEMSDPALLAPIEGLEPFVEGMVLE
ncbi:hypothetical protein AMAG_08982 [Allomyces macrogynus ATCC 38327]|uniref:DDHD domain-containing protein n=1 Tax=Allomyces macrogynus (strain ATCC 38327) TaxID=578462 RepID=A0A0L0SN46_ALLM3|nr:hypothetical protein AMAG_08982 [Allomyces macrogynus ATCC 38327]|eukprot:KNE63923.1 hypothetical protein AMAG_08982 [Allomyces macrogynus ATCC 38327]